MNIVRAAQHHEVMAGIGKPKPIKQKRAKRKHSKSERKMLEARLWKLTADYVKQRDGCCVTCGATEKLTISHYITARKQALRYDLRNCNAQCATCNNTHNYQPQFYTMYMVRHYGVDTLEELTARSRVNGFKWSVLNLREMVEDAERRLKPS
jgi:Bacteriophage Lambda NinG protein